MSIHDLTAEQRAELEAWGEAVAEKFESGTTPTPGATIPPLMELRRLRHQRRQVEALTTTNVRRARAEGDSWHTIGLALGTTAEAARQRYRTLAAA